MKELRRLVVAVFLVVAAFNIQILTIHAQGTAFTYQGQLQNNGSPANGTYNLTFALYTNATIGTMVAGPVTNNAVAVTNGLFTVMVDFGSSVWSGQTNWLQIGVETNDAAASFVSLTPRQELTPVPYAIFASSASNVVGTVSAGQINGTISPAQLPNGLGGVRNFILNTTSVVGGGLGNTNNGTDAVIGGGYFNLASGTGATIAGGYLNTNSAIYTTVGGGRQNIASGVSATVPGGQFNVAGGEYSFAAGQQAQATNQGAFVWADSQNAVFASTNNDSFNVRAQGGVRLVTSGTGLTVDGPATLTGLAVSSSQTGTFSSAVATVQNNSGGANTSPALRVVGYGNTASGALSVSSQGSGLIAQFGNGGAFVSDITTNGTFEGPVRVGSGTVITNMEAGQAMMPSSSLQETNFTIAFPTAFSSPPKIVFSLANDPNYQDVSDVFAASVCSNSTTAFSINVYRLNGTYWSQSLRVNWQAWQ
jgi:hypothetical protein